MSDVVVESDDVAERSTWVERWSWGALLGLGFLIYELTARPSFGISVACLKFGWNDVRTARWLWRRDPRRGRGWACFFFYLAFGLWKVTAAAVIFTGCLTALVTVLGRNPPEEFWHLAGTAAGGVVLLAVIPMIGVAFARRHGVRVWMDGSVSESRKENRWPPVATGFNAVSGLLFPAMIVPVMAAAFLAFKFCGQIFVPPAVFLTGVAIWSQFHGVTAKSPDECWTDPATECPPR